jgi:hypothetical protein
MRTAIVGLGYVRRSIAQAEVGVGHSEIGFHINFGVISSLSVSGDFKGTI